MKKRMKNQNCKRLYVALSVLILFIVWTSALAFLDVKPIGPNSSKVGFATLNSAFHNLSGVHMTLYNITDWLGLVPLSFVLVFALQGLLQWIKRKSIKLVDFNLFVLGGFYVCVMFAFVFFENFVVNYRPILIEGVLEASYPSSTTMLVMCVMPTTAMQLNNCIKNKTVRRCIISVIVIFTLFMVFARLVSGVHWLSDIVGGALLSFGLTEMYRFVRGLKK